MTTNTEALAAEWERKAAAEASRRNSAYDYFGMDNTPQNVDPLGARMAAELRRLAAVEKRLGEAHCDASHYASRLAEMEAERDALVADAERYRWLRQGDNDEEVLRFHEWAKEVCVDPPPMYLPRLERLDRLIDAAMKDHP